MFSTPTLVVSRCINKDYVRYNGGIVTNEFVKTLERFCKFIYFCPEVESGMGVPRNPLILLKNENKIKIFDPIAKIDWTDKVVSSSKVFLEKISDIDGFILKSKSPSCGVGDAKVYNESFKVERKSDGIFAYIVKEYFPYLAVEDEGRLMDFWIRRDFLTKIFALAELRQFIKNTRKIKDFVDFHLRYKYLIMLYSSSDLPVMGRIVAQCKEVGLDKSILEYEKKFRSVFSKKQTQRKNINVIQHIYGYFSKKINESERKYFLSLLKKFSEGKVNLKVVFEYVKSFIFRFENEYLSVQKYFFPYPEELENFEISC